MATAYNYPFAASPDVIRSHQKDAYFTGTLLSQLSSLLRQTYGARFAHNYTSETRSLAELIYFSLTTLIGNRTLGEEYCDIVQVEDDTLQLPDVWRRGGYILLTVGAPYALEKIMPTFRRRLRARLELSLRRSTRKTNGAPKTALQHAQNYILTHLDTLTSPAPIYALSLATFYFSGSYYHLAKRLLSLRYIFTRRIEPSDQRVGYEVLGVLLILQMSVQAWLHVHSTASAITVANSAAVTGTSAVLGSGVEVSLNPNDYSSNNALLFESSSPSSSSKSQKLQKITNTPLPSSGDARFTLEDKETMEWIQGDRQRKCTLCLEEMKDPSVTGCGHVFCWTCIGDWVREKPECPLCRGRVVVQHVLPLRS